MKSEQVRGLSQVSLPRFQPSQWQLPALKLLALAIFLSLLPDTARADACGQALSPPLISVRTHVRPATYDFNRGILDISADSNLAVPRDMADFKYATGATAVVTEREWHVQLQGQPRNGGGQCWWVTKLQITVTAHTKVHIAKELPRNSCLWKEVMRHESKHVKTDQKLFPRLADTVRPRIVKQVSHSVPAQDEAEAGDIFRDLISKATDDAINAFLVKRNNSQLAIDTREEYMRANRICGNAEISAAFTRAGIH